MTQRPPDFKSAPSPGQAESSRDKHARCCGPGSTETGALRGSPSNPGPAQVVLLAGGKGVTCRDVCGRLPGRYDDFLVWRLDQVEVGGVPGLCLTVDPPMEIAAV